MATSPQFTFTPRCAVGQLTTANTGRTGAGAVVSLITGVDASGTAPGGTKVLQLDIMGVGTVTAGMVRLFLSLDGGSTLRLIREYAITATTPSGTIAGYQVSYTFNNFVLPSANAILYASTHLTEIFNLTVHAGDLTGT